MMEIRRGTIEDLHVIAELFDLYRQFYKQKMDSPGAEAFIRERLSNNESVIFISEDEKWANGFVQLYPIFSSVRMERSWLLNDLYVRPECRNRGIATALINISKLLSVETDASGIMLETSKSNVEGNKLYPALGFSLQTDVNFYFWKNNQ